MTTHLTSLAQKYWNENIVIKKGTPCHSLDITDSIRANKLCSLYKSKLCSSHLWVISRCLLVACSSHSSATWKWCFLSEFPRLKETEASEAETTSLAQRYLAAWDQNIWITGNNPLCYKVMVLWKHVFCMCRYLLRVLYFLFSLPLMLQALVILDNFGVGRMWALVSFQLLPRLSFFNVWSWSFDLCWDRCFGYRILNMHILSSKFLR